MSTFSLFLHTFFALAIVLIVIAILSKLMRTGTLGKYRSSKLSSAPASIEVVSRKTLARHNYLAVVEVERKRFLVAVTAQSINLISVIDVEENMTALENSVLFPENNFPQLFLTDSSMDQNNGSPWKATPRQTPMAWDAFIEKLRGITIRH